MLAAIAEIKPRDALERMLAVQMALTHVALIRFARWLAKIENIDQVKAHYSGYKKLARTFTAQMEAMRKHRNSGKQVVQVQHVNVADGGKLSSGTSRPGGGVRMENDANPLSAANAAPRCTAKSKRTRARCKGPSVRGWTVCRFHGAGVGHGPGKANPAYKHGMYSQAHVEACKRITELGRQLRDIENLIK